MAIIIPRRAVRSLRVFQLATFAIGAIALIVALYLVRVVVSPERPLAPRTAAERVIFDAKDALKKDSRNIKARLDLGRVYIGIGQYESAISTLKIAVQLDRQNVEAFYLLGLAYHEKGEFDKALEHLSKAAKVKGAFAEQLAPVYQQMGKTYTGMGRNQEAVQSYRKALTYEPQDADVVFLLGQAYEKLGDRRAAIQAYKGVLEFLPDDKQAKEALEELQAAGKK